MPRNVGNLLILIGIILALPLVSSVSAGDTSTQPILEELMMPESWHGIDLGQIETECNVGNVYIDSRDLSMRVYSNGYVVLTTRTTSPFEHHTHVSMEENSLVAIQSLSGSRPAIPSDIDIIGWLQGWTSRYFINGKGSMWFQTIWATDPENLSGSITGDTLEGCKLDGAHKVFIPMAN